MRRIIKTYETCSDELLEKLAEKFPHGIKDRHISQLTTIKGDKIRIVELETEDTMYLIKFSDKLEEAIDDIDLDMMLDEDEEFDLGDEDGIDEKLVPDDMDEEDMDDEEHDYHKDEGEDDSDDEF